MTPYVHSMEPYSYRLDPDVPDFNDDDPIIVFDGYCALCSGWVDFLLKYDQGQFRFLSAQSPLGDALYAHYGYKSGDYQTNILIEHGIARIRSDGTLAMFERLGGSWRAMCLFRLIPKRLRDWGYACVARNRIGWFGQRDTCRAPTAQERHRFL